jgi:hypothetical protein
VSTVWRLEVKAQPIQLVARNTDAITRAGFCQNANPGETIETIGDITRKNSLVTQAPMNPNRSEKKC